MSFLKAEWRNLIMVNYIVNPDLLISYLPKGTELDLYNNQCYISLVGFMFLNTKVKGISVPFHKNFQEVNLRFYVKRKTEKGYKRGVVFIKEIVPKPALTFIANTIYKENYQTLPMQHSWHEDNENIEIQYNWKKTKWNYIKVDAQKRLMNIKEETEVNFIAEHYWGYAKVNDNKTVEYEVKHPQWKYYPISKHNIDVDFTSTYGHSFSFLNKQKPKSVMLLEGSEISVENKNILGFK